MKNKRNLVLLAVLAIIVLGAFTLSWECGQGDTCHALLQGGSDMYVLCANGHMELEVNGHDSWRVVCVHNDRTRESMSYMPVIGSE